ncbi:TIM barrel protein [Cytophagaceae bacterium DM2B3-1]|uniref:TIM barrel protein n=1 Tax=Xanthocytophaga flava TaxID=3048013 RepID=A0ABT7CQD9_9BACT|nr:TIM barrel protein [Xanthocytophaga flavus]MDJ1468045.1 TIM barrel protein [Xanthocytophaga flavus]MDJ1495940.1 TIM barrel protein [Xanthocytophaga flavus]
MTLNRRDFLKISGAAALSAWAMPYAQATPIKNIGIQLYTLRDVIGKDTKNVLTQLAKDGYKELEAYGIDSGKFFNLSGAEFKKIVTDLGMKTIGSHASPDVKFDKDVKAGLDAVAPNWKKAVETAKEGGLTYITCPWWKEEHRKSADDYKKSAAIINLLAEYAVKQGLKFTYHNHDFEFKKFGNTDFYDVLLAQTNPKAVNFEMDLYWVVAAGKNPDDYFTKYPGRFHQVHVKDMSKADKTKNTEVGKGSIDFAKILKLAPKAGIKHFFVEQENNYSPDSLASAKLCADYLKKFNY